MKDAVLTARGDFEEWRNIARGLLKDGVPPDTVNWRDGADTGSLFTEERATVPAGRISLPRGLLAIAERVICHRDPAAPARLYRIVWRAAQDKALMDRCTDKDVLWLSRADKAIRRDVHKMHAFVRFRRVGEDATGRERFAAWFEPEHHILRLAAPFFQRRYFGMDWAIFTPDARAIWQDETLVYGPPGSRDMVPEQDVVEDQWRTYYGAIFNPARVKIAAMRSEMPRKYWHNLPEAQDIGPLLAGAEARVERMREAAVSAANPRAEKWRAKEMGAMDTNDDPDTLEALSQALSKCTRCPLFCEATQAVAGEGAPTARIMLVGEQPGDREDIEGRPFVGPAGQLLDAALAEAGLDRKRLYLTNAVKHFKFEPRGKRRIHQTPTAGEIDICRWWLDKERALVKPDLIITLGASALRSVMGRKAHIGALRGGVVELDGGTGLIATIHPSYLLRLPDRERAAQERAMFVDDLARARQFVA